MSTDAANQPEPESAKSAQPPVQPQGGGRVADGYRQTRLLRVAGSQPTSDPASGTLTAAVRVNGATAELTVSGEWDLAQRHIVWQAIRTALEHGPEFVVLDLTELSFIDSSGIHNVVELHNRCMNENIHLVIFPGSPGVQRLFEICGLIDRLPFLGSER